MILLLLLGYLVAYLVVFMMFVAFCVAVCISFAAYVLSYLGAYAWQKIRYHRTPEWRYRRVTFVVNQEKVQEFATATGIASMVFLVFGFFLYAFTQSWPATLGWTGALAFLTVFFALDAANGKKRAAARRVTFGEIRDRHQ